MEICAHCGEQVEDLCSGCGVCDDCCSCLEYGQDDAASYGVSG